MYRLLFSIAYVETNQGLAIRLEEMFRACLDKNNPFKSGKKSLRPYAKILFPSSLVSWIIFLCVLGNGEGGRVG